jgi:hypothetical protein
MATEDEQIEMVYSARDNSFKALENNLRELSGGVPTDTCDHSGPFDIYHKCRKCGAFTREG